MKIIIVASSTYKTFSKNYKLNPSDYFIGVDGGCLELINRNIKMDIAIGDFDSSNDKINMIKENSYDMLTYQVKKDETDLELAFKHLETLKGANNLEIEVYDATGGRLDHEFNTYMLLAKYNTFKIKLIDDLNEVIYLKEGSTYKFRKKHYQYFSLFSLNESIITIKNALYELDNINLKISDTYAISNELLENNLLPTIEIKSGGILLFMIKNSNK